MCFDWYLVVFSWKYLHRSLQHCILARTRCLFVPASMCRKGRILYVGMYTGGHRASTIRYGKAGPWRTWSWSLHNWWPISIGDSTTIDRGIVPRVVWRAFRVGLPMFSLKPALCLSSLQTVRREVICIGNNKWKLVNGLGECVCRLVWDGVWKEDNDGNGMLTWEDVHVCLATSAGTSKYAILRLMEWCCVGEDLVNYINK